MLKILIGMSDTGGGHRSAAEALAAVIQEMRGDAVQVVVADLLSNHTFWPLNLARHTYAPMVARARSLWRFTWWLPEAPWRWRLLQDSVLPLLRGPLGGYLGMQRPDLYISVHPLLNHVALRLLRQHGNHCPVATVVTDLGGGHPTWFCPDMDLVTVGSQALYDLGLARGVPRNHLRLLGLPVNPRFSAPGQDQASLRRELGLAADRPTALVIGGGEGMGPLAETTHALAHQLLAVQGQVVVICGRNEKLRAELAAADWPIPVSVQGFVRNMAAWMTASDCVVTKAGPGTIIEACIVGRPVMLSDYVEGQETGNVTYVVQGGFGAFSREPEEIGRTVAGWLAPGNPQMPQMAARARALARPQATREIVQALLDLVEPHRPARMRDAGVLRSRRPVIADPAHKESRPNLTL